MHTIKFLPTVAAFNQAFQSCCETYDALDMYVAWVGDPRAVLPFEHISQLKAIRAVVGVAFSQSHPDGIRWLMEQARIRIANAKPLFHPKVFLFSRKGRQVALIGSSNFTCQGFCANMETNVLIEGEAEDKQLVLLRADLAVWRTKDRSFVPTPSWLSRYEKKYKDRRKRMRNSGLDDEVEEEGGAAENSAWIAAASWEIYYRMVIRKLRGQERNYRKLLEYRLNFFDLVEERIPIPWRTEYFLDLENRKIMAGETPHGWLGHVGASGAFRHLLANGSPARHERIVAAINSISRLSHPVDWRELRRQLIRLTNMGPTMKVWSRLLAITRPDLFCTISAPSVRRNLSALG